METAEDGAITGQLWEDEKEVVGEWIEYCDMLVDEQRIAASRSWSLRIPWAPIP